MKKIRGKSLKEWKKYCAKDNVPIKTIKYITCLEEQIKQLTLTDVVHSGFYCQDAENSNGSCHCPKQCNSCVGY